MKILRIIIGMAMLITPMSTASADDQNVYDAFRKWLKPTADATVDEQITARVKRNMANLLYPVDMSSFVGPDKDTKFRDLIIVLQKQMGVTPTGVLTEDQFGRLAEASRYINGELIGLQPNKYVSMTEDSNSVLAAGTGAMEDLAEPINFVRISCSKAARACEINDATFNPKERFLFLGYTSEYEIDTWSPSRVTAKSQAPCVTSLMTIDIKGNEVTIVTVPQPDSTNCAGVSQKPSTWKLVDGFPVAWKLNQDLMNQARSLVYPSAKRLVTIQ